MIQRDGERLTQKDMHSDRQTDGRETERQTETDRHTERGRVALLVGGLTLR